METADSDLATDYQDYLDGAEPGKEMSFEEWKKFQLSTAYYPGDVFSKAEISALFRDKSLTTNMDRKQLHKILMNPGAFPEAEEMLIKMLRDGNAQGGRIGAFNGGVMGGRVGLRALMDIFDEDEEEYAQGGRIGYDQGTTKNIIISDSPNDPRNMTTSQLISIIKSGRSTPEMFEELRLRGIEGVDLLDLAQFGKDGEGDVAYSLDERLLDEYDPDVGTSNESFLMRMRESNPDLYGKYKRPEKFYGYVEDRPVLKAKGGIARLGFRRGSRNRSSSGPGPGGQGATGQATQNPGAPSGPGPGGQGATGQAIQNPGVAAQQAAATMIGAGPLHGAGSTGSMIGAGPLHGAGSTGTGITTGTKRPNEMLDIAGDRHAKARLHQDILRQMKRKRSKNIGYDERLGWIDLDTEESVPNPNISAHTPSATLIADEYDWSSIDDPKLQKKMNAAADKAVNEYLYKLQSGEISFPDNLQLEMDKIGDEARHGMVKSEKGIDLGHAFTAQAAEDISKFKGTLPQDELGGLTRQEYLEKLASELSEGGRVGAFGGGVMGIGTPGMRLPGIPQMASDGLEYDMKAGGFQPLGAREGKDDVKANLAKNEFVMTADAVRGAGGGNIEVGAQKMYDTMKRLEGKVA